MVLYRQDHLAPRDLPGWVSWTGKDEMMDLREYILQRCEELRKQQLKPALQEPVIVGLIRLLPPVGAPFPKREKWLNAMDATLAMLYPEK